MFNQEVVVPFPAVAIDFSTSDVCRQALGVKQPIIRQVLLEYKAAGASSNSPQWAMTSSSTRFLDHTQRRATVGRIPLDEWSARRRDPYLTTPNTHIHAPGGNSTHISQQASDCRTSPYTARLLGPAKQTISDASFLGRPMTAWRTWEQVHLYSQRSCYCDKLPQTASAFPLQQKSTYPDAGYPDRQLSG